MEQKEIRLNVMENDIEITKQMRFKDIEENFQYRCNKIRYNYKNIMSKYIPPAILKMKVGELENSGYQFSLIDEPDFKYTIHIPNVLLTKSNAGTMQSTFLTDEAKQMPLFNEISAINKNETFANQNINTNNTNTVRKLRKRSNDAKMNVQNLKPSTQLVNISNSLLRSTGRTMLRSTVKKFISGPGRKIVFSPSKHKKDNLIHMIANLQAKEPRVPFNEEKVIAINFSEQGTPLLMRD